MTAEETAAKIISKVGLWWPLAEEDQLRTAAGGYEACAKSVRAAAATGTAGAKLVTGGNTGKAIDAFDKFWAQYDGDGEAGLPATAQAAENIAAALKEFAEQVDKAKKQIINLAIEIGATIAVGVGMALFTFGGSAAAASARTAMLVARGWLIARGLSAVAARIVTGILATAAFGAVEGFTSSIVAQTAQMALTDGDGISLSKAMDWAKWGAVTAPAVAGAGVALRSGYRALRGGRSAVTPTHGLPVKAPGNVAPAGGGGPPPTPTGLPGSSGSGTPKPVGPIGTPNPATPAPGGPLPGLVDDHPLFLRLQAKYDKHAADFGITATKNGTSIREWGAAIKTFLDDPSTVRVPGWYRNEEAILNFNPTTGQLVLQKPDGTFISAWKMSPAQLQHALTDRRIGGG